MAANDRPELVGLENFSRRDVLPARFHLLDDLRLRDDETPRVPLLAEAFRQEGEAPGPRIVGADAALDLDDGRIPDDKTVIEIERRIRAYNPWPGCFTFLPERFRKKGNSGRLVVTKAKIIKKMEPGWEDVTPGKVLKADKLGPIIRCHDTALQLLEVKPEGSSLMAGGAFLSGRPLKPFEDFL